VGKVNSNVKMLLNKCAKYNLAMTNTFQTKELTQSIMAESKIKTSAFNREG
jgi:hypothetical protein